MESMTVNISLLFFNFIIFLIFRNRLFHNGIPIQSLLGFVNRISVHLKKPSEVLFFILNFHYEITFCFILDNDIDGSVLLKLSESMVVRLFPTIKLEVQFLDLLQALRQRHAAEINSRKTFVPPSPPLTNGRPTPHHVSDHSSSSSPPENINGHHETSLPLKALKNEPRCFPNQYEKPHPKFASKLLSRYLIAQNNGNLNTDSNENDIKHSFPHVYKLPQFAETLRLALASQDASAFKLRTYYRNLLISSIYDDLTRTYNLW